MIVDGQDLGLTYSEVLQYILDSMGAPAIKLYTPARTIQTQIDQVLSVLSRRKPLVKFDTLGARPGVQTYPVDPARVGYGVVDILVPRLDPIAPLLLSAGPRLDIFGYRYSYPYRDIAELEIDYVYFEMATRVLSSDIDWEYIDGAIWIYPTPTDGFQFTYCYLAPKYLGNEVTKTRCAVPMADWDWIKDASLAKVKIVEGQILSRLGSIPGTNFTQTLNGPDLIRDGKMEWEDKLRDLESRVPNIPFSKGTAGGRLVVGF